MARNPPAASRVAQKRQQVEFRRSEVGKGILERDAKVMRSRHGQHDYAPKYSNVVMFKRPGPAVDAVTWTNGPLPVRDAGAGTSSARQQQRPIIVIPAVLRKATVATPTGPPVRSMPKLAARSQEVAGALDPVYADQDVPAADEAAALSAALSDALGAPNEVGEPNKVGGPTDEAVVEDEAEPQNY